ncbi:hypothetical protein LguiA_032816 [Lonicera macranthoides]
MADSGIVRSPGSLDPRAQEFRPTNSPHQNSLTFLQTQIYYPYTSIEQQVAPFKTTPLPPALPPPSPTPSRTLLLSSVPTEVSESTIRRELEVFGDVRAVEMERVRKGIVSVHFYDVRHAESALMEIQEQHMQHQCRLSNTLFALHNNYPFESIQYLVLPLPPPARGLIAGRAVWAQFTIPVTGSLLEGHNQGTLVIFNLESDVSTTSLRKIFEAFGAVKELRETPLKGHQKYVEFYDIRAAAKALSAMNGKEICGKQVVIEFSRPGVHYKKINTINRLSSMTTNYSTKDSSSHPYLSLPPSPPQQLRPPLCGKTCAEDRSRGYGNTPRCYKISQGHNSTNDNKRWSLNNRSGGGYRIQTSTSLSGNEEEANSIRVQKDNSKKDSKSSTANTKQQQRKSGGNMRKGGWRQPGNVYDPHFLIKEDAIVESDSTDSRTTLMIKNIPNKYSQKLLLNMLDNHCIHCNEQIADGDDQQQQPFSSYNFGVEALKEHFKKSKFGCEEEEYLPVVFCPPRDGRLLTPPIPIVARPSSSSSSSLLSFPTITANNDLTSADGGHDHHYDHVSRHPYSINDDENDVDTVSIGMEAAAAP